MSFDEDAKEGLNTHFRLLLKQCDQFDEGDTDQAWPICNSLRSLLHDSDKDNPQSFFALCGFKHRIPFVDTASPRPKPDRKNFYDTWCGLVTFDNGFRSGLIGYRAKLSYAPVERRLKFTQWWNERIFDNFQGKFMSRKDFIIGMANKEGATHIDKRGLPENYALASKKEHVNRFSGTLDKSNNWESFEPVRPMARDVVRQVAHEVLETYFPFYYKLPPVPIFEGDVHDAVGFKFA